MKAVAISAPTTPPPMMASRSGTDVAEAASRLVQGAASLRPGIPGRRALLPVETTTAWQGYRVPVDARRTRCILGSGMKAAMTMQTSAAARPKPRASVNPVSLGPGLRLHERCTHSREGKDGNNQVGVSGSIQHRSVCHCRWSFWVSSRGPSGEIAAPSGRDCQGRRWKVVIWTWGRGDARAAPKRRSEVVAEARDECP